MKYTAEEHPVTLVEVNTPDLNDVVRLDDYYDR